MCIPNVPGFSSYTIIHTEAKGCGKYVFAVKKLAEKDEDVQLEMLELEGASEKRNPLKNVKNCQLKVTGGMIQGIDIDGDCVLRK